jgi:protein phosphatase
MIALEAAGLTDRGRTRPRNEDAFAVVSPPDLATRGRKGYLLAVADGLGGHAAGQVASAAAVEELVSAYYAPASPTRVEPALQRAVQVANLRVYERAQHDPACSSMQTTLTCVVLAGRSAYLAHVGDSRAYLVRDETIVQLTDDHSEAADLARLRLLPPEVVADHPGRSILTRTIGSQPLLRPDFRRVPVQPGDALILCTDGLWSEVTAHELRAAAACPTPAEACQRLIELQRSRESADNATVQVGKVLRIDDEPQEPGRWLGRLLSRAGAAVAPGRGASR